MSSKLHKKQIEFWKACDDFQYNYLFFGGGAGGGKTRLLCEKIHSLSAKYAGIKCLLGRKELKQLKLTTLSTLWIVYKNHNFIKDRDFHYDEKHSIITYNNGSKILLTDLEYKPSDPEVQDLGSLELTKAFIDEMPEINYAVFDVLRTRVGRCMNDEYNLKPQIIGAGNPIKNWVYVNFIKDPKERYKFVQALEKDNPYSPKDYSSQLDDITDAKRRARLRDGLWEYDNDPSSLIPYDSIIDCFTNTFVPVGRKYITADIARFGEDKTVVMVWNGLRSIAIETLNKSSIPECVTLIEAMAHKYNVPSSQIIIDQDGVGGGVVDSIKNCRSFTNNATPIEVKGKKENYNNLKSQCYYHLSDKIKNNEIYIDCQNDSIKNYIIEELEQVKEANPDGSGKLSVIPKDEVKRKLGRSPDYSDTLMMRMWFELQPSSQFLGASRV